MVVCGILAAASISINAFVHPSVPAFASTFHHPLPWCFIRRLEIPTACESQICKVICQISRSHGPKT